MSGNERLAQGTVIPVRRPEAFLHTSPLFFLYITCLVAFSSIAGL